MGVGAIVGLGVGECTAHTPTQCSHAGLVMATCPAMLAKPCNKKLM